MDPGSFVSLLGETKATAIIRTSLAWAVRPAMEAAIEGGFRIIEFTLNTPEALECIEEFAGRDGLVVGAGTVLTPEHVRRSVDAGAAYLVSPVVDDEIIAEAAKAGVAMMPGTRTPTEMLQAHRAGALLQKLFPAPSAGPAFVRACLGPLPFLRIVPTNGVNESNVRAYLEAGAHAVGFVNPLFDPDDLRHGRFERIARRARRLLEAVSER
ncbi:MAG: bifunctional 4-hydroxy-2-oxoglutarate aldolase/2-dehydro-3-deoxy-phosphogluconate aldolase [bacterium]|nr:bifunctional 4-hydroxy-2-oxoglutarate aldolase/2-dehydro-3-deoxy-phosphogluconate aldolase [bacterium]